MARRAAPLRLASEACAGHPGLRAWQALGGRAPSAVIVLVPESPSRKSAIYRLEGAAAGGGAVVAKRCARETAAFERRVYQEILAGLSLPSLHCFGVGEDADPRFAWLYLEDARGSEFDPQSPAHRALAATWLAALHTGAEGLDVVRSLPDRGPDHYLDHLRSGRRRIGESFANPALRDDDRELLDRILRRLDVVESQWTAVEEACAAAPRTLVHGDLSGRNARVEDGGSDAALRIFDWEVAGFGVPGVDLVRADLEVYAASVRERWPRLDVPLQARVGRLLRGCLAPIGWESLSLEAPWVEGPLHRLASYLRRLEDFLAESGFEGGGARRPPAANDDPFAAGDPRAHPAARAWRRLGRSDATLSRVEPLRRKRRAQVFRLRGILPGADGVVAKRTTRPAGEIERCVYEQALPTLPFPTLRLHGALPDGDACWLFLEDAGCERVAGPVGRALLTDWLARFHTSASALADALRLPDRGAGPHRAELRAACRTILAHLGKAELSPADRWVLRGLVAGLERLDARWHEIEALLGGMPRTLVHGDFAAGNLRLRRANGHPELLVLDWETAGIGPPAVDLAEVDPSRYAALVSGAWPEATPEEVARWKACGLLLRAIVATGWEAPDLAFPWVEKPMARLRVYRRRLEEGIARLEHPGVAP